MNTLSNETFEQLIKVEKEEDNLEALLHHERFTTIFSLYPAAYLMLVAKSFLRKAKKNKEENNSFQSFPFSPNKFFHYLLL
jgi:hypothetical protein